MTEAETKKLAVQGLGETLTRLFRELENACDLNSNYAGWSDLCDGVGERQPLRKTASKLSLGVPRVWRRLPSPLQNNIAPYQVETGFSLATIPPPVTVARALSVAIYTATINKIYRPEANRLVYE